MEKFIEKLTKYHFISYLIPGGLIVFVEQFFLGISVLSDNTFINFCIIYILGLIASRIGAIIIEPFYKWTHIVSYADYSDFVKAEKIDSKIQDLLEINNLYRSILGTILFIGIISIYQNFSQYCVWIADHPLFITCIILFIVFSFAFRKQTSLIKKRVEANLESESEN